MKTINVRELRQSTPHLKQTLAEEGEVLLVSHGEPIARLLPIESKAAVSKLPSMKMFRAAIAPMKLPSQHLIRENRDRRGT